MFHLDIHASMLYQHVGMIVLVCPCVCLYAWYIELLLCSAIAMLSLCYYYIIHVSLLSYIQTCLNSFCFEFTCTYYVFKNILLVVHTQSSILCHCCIFIFTLKLYNLSNQVAVLV